MNALMDLPQLLVLKPDAVEREGEEERQQTEYGQEDACAQLVALMILLVLRVNGRKDRGELP